MDGLHLHGKNFTYQESSALTGLTNDDVGPNVSVSNISSRGHGTKSKTSNTRTSSSSTTSARVKVEADVAALLARQRLLQEKHALEQHEEEIRRRKERLELEA